MKFRKAHSIAVIDDDEGMRLLLCDFLQRRGFDALPFGSGQEFLQSDAPWRVALILSDLQLGKESGLDVLNEINRRQSNIPFVLMTCYGCEQELPVTAADVTAILRKPFKLSEVEQVIVNALSLGVPENLSLLNG